MNLKDQASIARLRMTLYTTLDRTDMAVEVGLEFLRNVGIAWLEALQVELHRSLRWVRSGAASAI